MSSIGNYQYYYTVFTYYYVVWVQTSMVDTTTITTSTTTETTRLSVYAANTDDAQSQFRSLENVVKSLASSQSKIYEPSLSGSTAATASTGGAPPGLGRGGVFNSGDVAVVMLLLLGGLTGVLAAAL